MWFRALLLERLRAALTAHNVIIVGPGHDHFGGDLRERKIWYFGRDYARYLKLCAAANDARLIAPVGEIINAVAGNLAPEVIELDQHLASGLFPISWLSSDLAERNPYTSSFYLDLCRAIGLIEAARSGGLHLVVVDEADLGSALAALCRDNGISARWRPGYFTSWRCLRAMRAHAGFVRGWWRQWLALRRYPSDPEMLGARSLWLMSWAEGQNSNGDVPTADRFFQRLPDWLRQNHVNFGWLYNPVTWLRPIDAIVANVMKSSQIEPSVLVGQFFSWRDLFRGYARLVALPFAIKRRFVMGSADVTRIVRLALARDLASPRLISASRYVNVAFALKSASLAPRAVFYTYENQPWEKAMLAGFRRALPSIVMVGVQHAPLPERYLSGHPSRRQWADGTAPDLLITIGAEFRERLTALGAPPDRVIVGGSLRHADLLVAQIVPPDRTSREPRMVLASCSMELSESFELAHKAAVATAGIAGLRLAINFHPMVDNEFRDTICERLPKLVDCKHVEFVEGSAVQWLEKADILLYNSSSTAFEATVTGIPVIHVGSDIALDLDNMSGAEILRCRQPDELRRHIEALLGDSDLRNSAVEGGRAHLTRCFTVPDSKFWSALAKRVTERKVA
jgi:hypothetical protein